MEGPEKDRTYVREERVGSDIGIPCKGLHVHDPGCHVRKVSETEP